MSSTLQNLASSPFGLIQSAIPSGSIGRFSPFEPLLVAHFPRHTIAAFGRAPACRTVSTPGGMAKFGALKEGDGMDMSRGGAAFLR